MARTSNLLSPIAFAPARDKHVAVRRDSKTANVLTAMLRRDGVTLEEAAKILSKTGASCTPAYARAWIAPSYLAAKGYGVRSEVEGQGKRARLRLWAYVNQPDEPAVGVRDGHVDPVAEARRKDEQAERARAKRRAAPAPAPAEQDDNANATE